MRIIAGTMRGKAIHAPPGDRVRPTSDRVREAMFSILGDRVVDAWVLDAYAGVGTVGLEALSRGSANCDFIEANRGVLSYLRKNISRTGFVSKARVFAQRVERFVGGWREGDSPYEIVFADPPYGEDPTEIAQLLRSLVAGMLILETSDNAFDPSFGGYRLTDRRRYGNTVLYFLEPD